MPKSNYPSKLDTSVEIPAVRDNVTEISSDVLNSLRDAIFQIERTLGVNPQGSTGNTVSSRLNRTLDDNGNILDSALDRANVLSGPITDVDVSDVAAISESKLRLDIATRVLQSQVSLVSNRIDEIIAQLTELSVTLSVHINPAATNRHNAVAISVEEAAVLASDISTNSLEAGTSQGTFETLYNAHINYSGANISTLNNAHDAGQIFFDNDSVNSIVPSDSVQGAIEDLVNIQSVGVRDGFLNLHSNGRIRTGSVLDGYESLDLGSLLLDSNVVTYTLSAGTSRTTFSLTAPTAPIEAISEFDILTLSGSEFDTDNAAYQVVEVADDGGGNIISITVYGGPQNQAAEEVSIQVTRNTYTVYNLNGLNATVRPRSLFSNTPDVVLASPDAATIITTGIQAAALEDDVHAFDIEIDGGTAVTIETYDSSVSNQTIDSIVNKINDQAVAQHLNFYAYKIRTNTCFELALAHTLPNSSNDIKNRTLKISAGATDDGTGVLNFGDFLDLEVEGTSTNSFFLNGLVLTEFGKIQTLTGNEAEIIASTLDIKLFSGTFAALGIRIGDTVVITGSSAPDDDGSYRIKSVIDDTVTLDLQGETLDGTIDENSIIHFVRNAAPVEELNFTESVSVDGSILFDVFLTEDKDIHYHKRMEIGGALTSGLFTAAVVDVSRNFIQSGQTSLVTVDPDGTAYLTGPDLQDGETVFVGGTGLYKLFSSDRLSFVTLSVNAQGNPSIQQQVTLFGFDEISRNNYRVCRALFATSLGIVLGESADLGVPSVIDKRASGTTDETIVGESFIERYIQGPRNELRGSGIIRGLEVVNAQFIDTGETDEFGDPIIYQTVDISAGVAVVNGIRFEYPGILGYRFNDSERFYLAMDGRGCINAGVAVDNPDGYTDGYQESISPFAGQVVAHLARVNAETSTIVDLRLFVDHIDYKLIGDITVAKSQEFGHFTDIKKGIDYAKNFTTMFPEQSNPTIFIAEGNYEVDERIIVNFDCTISGAGPSTVITKSGTLAAGIETATNRPDSRNCIFLIGAGRNSNSDRIYNGVTLRDFTYQTSGNLEFVGNAITLSQGIGANTTSADAMFRFENINFIGPEGINNGVLDEENVGEYALVIGRQSGGTFIPSSGIQMGNIVFTGCKLKRMGLEEGGIYYTDSTGGSFSNIIITENVALEMSPNLGSTSNDIFEYKSVIVPTLDRIIEASNSVTY